MKRLLILGLLYFMACGCEKDGLSPIRKSKYETGYASMQEMLDSFNLKSNAPYRFRLYYGRPYVTPLFDSGSVVIKVSDSTFSTTGGRYPGAFKFRLPDFNADVSPRDIVFSQAKVGADTTYPFVCDGYTFVHQSDTYLTDPGHKYRPDTTKIVRATGGYNCTLFIYK